MTDEKILEELHQLPENLKTEVYHFITFLRKEYSQENKTDDPKKRVFGRSKGKYILAQDFDAPLDDFKDYM